MSNKSIIVKIYEFDAGSNSLIVSFNSDKSTTDIDQQCRYNYEISMFDTLDPDLVIKHIARSGLSIVEMQDKKEEISKNTTLNSLFIGYAGKTLTFEEKALYNELDNTAPDEDIAI